MALVIETGDGVPNANSYVSIVFATAYLTQRNRLTENGYDTATEAVKEGALVSATEYIDTRWGTRFKGRRYKKFSTKDTEDSDEYSQSLEFPRVGLSDRNGRVIEGVPVRLCFATVEYAVRALGGSLYSDPEVDESGRVVQRRASRVGPIQEETTFEEGGGLTHLLKPYPAADRLLLEYV